MAFPHLGAALWGSAQPRSPHHHSIPFFRLLWERRASPCSCEAEMLLAAPSPEAEVAGSGVLPLHAFHESPFFSVGQTENP